MNPTGKNKCFECGRMCPSEKVFTVDNSCLCPRCLFGDGSPVEIYPIGYVSEVQAGEGNGSTGRNSNPVSTIELLPSQKRFMYKLEEEKELTVVYHLHKSGPIRSRFRRKLDGKEVGVFASHTPHRPSPIGIQDVRLRRVEGTTLTVEGLDAFQGTPVLDIKSAGHGKS